MIPFVRQNPFQYSTFEFCDNPVTTISLTWQPDYLAIIVTDNDQDTNYDDWYIDLLYWDFTGPQYTDARNVEFGEPGTIDGSHIDHGVIVYNLKPKTIGGTFIDYGYHQYLTRLLVDTYVHTVAYDFWGGINTFLSPVFRYFKTAVIFNAFTFFLSDYMDFHIILFIYFISNIY